MNTDERLNQLLDEHRNVVFLRTLRLTHGDAAWAEDVVQETFLRAWRHRDRMTPEHGPVRAWLLRVAHNLVMDGYRSARLRDHVSIDEVQEPAMPEATDQILSACVVRDALRHLPEGHRVVLEATYLRDQTAEQAARQLNLPVGTVKSRVFYGLRMLRSIIDQAAPADALAA